MKKLLCWLLSFTLLISAFIGCSSNPEQEPTDTGGETPAMKEVSEEKAEDTASSGDSNDASQGVYVLSEESVSVTGDSPSTVGSLDTGVVASFDAGAFESGSTVSVAVIENTGLESPDKNRFELSGKAYDFTLEGTEYVRPNAPITVTLQLDESMITSLEDEGFFQLAYYYKDQWYLQDVDEVNMEAGTATVTLHHFCWFFEAKLTKEELRDQKAQEMAEQEFYDENNMERIKKEGQDDLKKMIMEATGVTDTTAVQAVAEYILNDNDYSSLMLQAGKMDGGAFSTKMAEIVAKNMKSAASIGNNANYVAGAFSAAGYLWEGDPQGAAEAMSHAILDSNPYGKLLKLSIAVTDASIKTWKKEGIEEMYQAYKNGADDGWFGYNVEKGDFETALEQSAAIERQISIDAVKSYCNIYGEKEEDLTEAELAEIKKDAVEKLKDTFKDRLEKEAEIAENKDYYKKLLDAFENNKVDDSITLKVPMMDDLPYEQRLEAYNRVTEKLMEMTGKKKIDFDGLVDDSEIPIDAITTAIKKWYEEDGENKVKEYFREKGYLPRISIRELDGDWSGTLTIEEIHLDQALIDSMIADVPDASEEGCDAVDINNYIEQLYQMEGEVQDFSVSINTTSDKTLKMYRDGEQIGDFKYDPVTQILTMIPGTSTGSEEFDLAMTFSVTDASHMSGTAHMENKAGVSEGVSYDQAMLRMKMSISLSK